MCDLNAGSVSYEKANPHEVLFKVCRMRDGKPASLFTKRSVCRVDPHPDAPPPQCEYVEDTGTMLTFEPGAPVDGGHRGIYVYTDIHAARAKAGDVAMDESFAPSRMGITIVRLFADPGTWIIRSTLNDHVAVVGKVRVSW